VIERAIQTLKDRVECFDNEGIQPTTRQKIAKTIPTTKPTGNPKNNTKHQRGDENGLKLTAPLCPYKALNII
jgi:hypothetical protein